MTPRAVTIRLEVEAQLPLETPGLITFGADRAKVCAVYAVLRRWVHSSRNKGVRMVQDVSGINPDLNLLTLSDPKALAQAAVEPPGPRSGDGPLSQCSAMTR